MKSAILIGLLLVLSAAQAAEEKVVELPPVKVLAKRLERYTVMTARAPDGSLSLILKPGPRSADMLAILISGVQPGDEIITINGREVATLPRNGWSAEFSGAFTLTIRRPAGRRAFQIIEVEGRRA